MEDEAKSISIEDAADVAKAVAFQFSGIADMLRDVLGNHAQAITTMRQQLDALIDVQTAMVHRMDELLSQSRPIDPDESWKLGRPPEDF